MPKYTVKKGDTMWSLTSRALREQTGRKPTNAEINAAMRNASRGPRSNKNLIKPGETVNIYLPGARGSDGPRKKIRAGARAASAADRYSGSTSRSSGTPKKKTRIPGGAAAAERYSGSSSARSSTKKTASSGGRSVQSRNVYRAPGSAADNRSRIQRGNKKAAPKKKSTGSSNYRAPGSAAEMRARIEGSRPKKKKSTVVKRAQTTAYARSRQRYPGS